MTLKEKIKDRMDALQRHMESNHHLKHSWLTYELIESVSKFWSVLSEEDKDFIHAARHALEEHAEWK